MNFCKKQVSVNGGFSGQRPKESFWVINHRASAFCV